MDFTDLFIPLVKKAYAGLAGYAQEHDFFNTATKKYLNNIREDFGHVRVLGMKNPVPLDSLYVRANILEKISVRTGALPEEMEKNRDQFFKSFSDTIETVDGEAIIDRNENLIVLGKPGAGKTTYLKYLTLRMASKDKDSNIKQRRIPIFITLHEFAKTGKPLLDYIAEQFDLCGFEYARSFIERLLSNGDCLVLLDGLDEVSRETRLDTVIQEVTDFTRKYRDSRFVVSCRIASYNHWFSQFKEVEVADFNEPQIKDFVGKYFQKEQETAKRCFEKLQENERLMEMACSPLLLTLLCITYDERQDFPPNRAMLYGRAMDALLNRWDAERRIKRDKIYKDLDETRLISLLSRLAAGYFEMDTYFFGETELCKAIGNILADMAGEQNRDKGVMILQDIEQHYGLLIRRSQWAFSFSHLTFMEYFTAHYIVDKALEGAIDGLIETHFCDERWLEVFLLTVGKLGTGADGFLLRLQRKNRQTIRVNPELNNLFLTIQKAILLEKNKYSSIEREWSGLLFVLFLAFARDRDRGLTFARALDRAVDLALDRTLDLVLSRDRSLDSALDRALDLTLDRDRARALDLALDRALDRDRALALDRALDLALDFALDRDKLTFYVKENNFNIQTASKIEIYLKGNIWIAKCLNSGATISAGVREKILEDMFKPV